MALLLAGCGDPSLSTLLPQGPIAREQYDMMLLSFYLMMGVFVVVIAIYAYVLIRYRKRPGQDEIPEQVEGNHKLEFAWTAIPIILLIIIIVPMVSMTFSQAETFDKTEALQVKVTAHQFWWEFEYPDLGIQTAQDLVIPVNEKIQFHVTSDDVVHSFWVPAIAGKIDANPGLINKMWFTAENKGVFKGKCAELCGFSHALMDFRVVVVEGNEFDNWVASMKDFEVEPKTELAIEGQELFNKNCMSCHAVDGQGGTIGPNLTVIGDREVVAGFLENDKDHLKKWIANSQEFKPGNKMPAFSNLSDEQLDALAEFLGGLKVE